MHYRSRGSRFQSTSTVALLGNAMRHHNVFRVSFILACLLGQSVTAHAQKAPTGDLVSRSSDQELQPGDHVKITVIGEDKDLSGEFEVAPNGTLKHPLYSQVKVAGIPLPMLKEQFGSFLKKFQ